HGVPVGIKEALMNRLTARGRQQRERGFFWGLKDIDLTLKRGDRLGLVGHNGAGKSTLLKVISHIYRPTQGTVTVRGSVAPLTEIGAGFNLELSGRENAYLNGSI